MGRYSVSKRKNEITEEGKPLKDRLDDIGFALQLGLHAIREQTVRDSEHERALLTAIADLSRVRVAFYKTGTLKRKSDGVRI